VIYLECKPDEILTARLGVPKKERKHCHDKGRVCRMLMKGRGLTGLMDEDPGCAQPRYITSLEEEEEVHSIRVKYDRKRDNRVILLCPTLERWMLTAAAAAGVDVEKEFGLPRDPSRFHAVVNARLEQYSLPVERLTRTPHLTSPGKILAERGTSVP